MNANTIVQGSEDLKLRMWDCRDSSIEAAATLTGYVYFPLCIDVVTDENYVCTGSKGFDGVGCELRVWDMRSTKECVSILSGHRQSVVGCRFLNGSKNSIVSVSKDQTLKVWDVDRNCIAVDELGHTGSQFTCVSVLDGVVCAGAANGYSQYEYDGEKASMEHVRTYGRIGE